MLLGELERLQFIDEPDAKDRIAYATHAAAKQRRRSRMRVQRGRLQGCRGSPRGRQRACDAVLQRQFYVLHGWKSRGESEIPRFFDIGT